MDDAHFNQLPPSEELNIREWFRRQTEEAVNNAAVPISDYTTATMFDLIEHAKRGDVKASDEIANRRAH